MNKKYELLRNDYIEYEGTTLYRIKALRDFGNVKAGELGGYIEKEDNLSHEHNCWVYKHAKVFGNAEVYDNAYVYGNAEVYQNAKITCNSRVYGDAKIEEDTIIGKVSIPYKKIFQYQCAKRLLTAILTEDDKILYSLGCQDNITEEEFIDRIHNTFGGLKYNPHREEYLDIIKLLNIYL